MTAYAFNAMDRNIISIVGQLVKLDLGLSDTQLGLLTGTAFALLYAFGGIPIARLAERVSRVNIIAASLIVWSGLCALCGAASSFSQLLLIRVGVGVAESGCSPPAHSLISDYFGPQRRASALSIYTCGISLGYLLAAVVGGFVAQHWGWRAACATVGLPGVAIAILVKLYVEEPRLGCRPLLPPFSLKSEWRELTGVARELFTDRPVLHMVLGVLIGAFAAYGFYAFVPSYLRRVFELDYTTVGILAGLAGGVAVGLGILAGGFIADALAERNPRWYALVPALGGIGAVPFYFLAVAQRDWRAATGLLATAGFLQYASLGPTFGVVQNIVDRRRRATATALLYVLLNVIALGGGPPFTGWVIDRFAGADFTRQSAAPHAASFATDCPGGVARASGEAARTACASALAGATRKGMLVTLLFFAWACVHYLFASAGIARSLKAAAARNATANS
jgi:predicted MFS family arabinose efflux permease